ncbi:hypothetical protein [Nitrobacter winogradskyi]|uniref:Uncharacterized protein n=1 Tax=Nitrobacter winogradskyi TaxID=913 RepID=A0ACC6AQ47_NITWI|nr:hypothetical protein [Nitrobacter winogradskyi]MCP2001386.1 hypothetical protein [Nitrobacter winogradskyi]
MAAAGLVALTGTAWPDLVVAFVIAVDCSGCEGRFAGGCVNGRRIGIVSAMVAFALDHGTKALALNASRSPGR